MKPKNLKSPFSWNERKVLIQDQIWYVPDYLEDYSAFMFPGWSALFGNENPVNIEYCSGNGAWIAEKAIANPESNWVAVELKFERVRKIWSKIKNHQIGNLFVICGEGYRVTSEYFPSFSFQNIFINFPDPWPKKRHAKHRIIQPNFVDEMARVLRDQGEFTVVTDDTVYSEQVTDVIAQNPSLLSLYDQPPYTHHIEGYGSSYFDQLWRNKGKMIYYHQYQKR